MNNSHSDASSTILKIAEQFCQAENIFHISPYGKGLINDTYLVKTLPRHSPDIILQRLNRQIFTRPEQIIGNLETINKHIGQITDQQIKLQIPEVIKTLAGRGYYYDKEKSFWRAIQFISNSCSFDCIENPFTAHQVGFALGHFHKLLSDLPSDKLHDTLPGFHITPGYLNHYQHLLQDSENRLSTSETRFCHDFITLNQHQANRLEKAKQQSLLLIRVTHGDPKINNILFSKDTGEAISIIDLDTVKPGLIQYDIGDCLRSACHTSNPVRFDLDICETVLKGYFEEAHRFFTAQDYQYLYAAIKLLPFELGLRFFTDYLQGDCYFKVTEPNQNLYRAIGQFELMQSITAQEQQIHKLINSLQ